MVVVDRQWKKGTKKMSWEQSDGEIGPTGAQGVQVEEETEVEFRLSRGTGPGLDGMQREVPVVTGAAEAYTCDPGQTHRRVPLVGRTVSVLSRNAIYTIPGA